MSDSLKEVYKQYRTAQDKYTYFLLAAAAAAIGLSLQHTTQSVLEWSMIFLGLAVLCWGISFSCGCRYLQYIGSCILANMALLQVKQGTHPNGPRNFDDVPVAAQGIKDAIESKSKKARRLGNAQFRFLIAGALLFISWHITAMTMRTLHPDDTINKPSEITADADDFGPNNAK